jgi:transposase
VKNRISFTKNYLKKHIGVVIFSILTTTILKRIIKGNIKRAIKIFNLVMKEIFIKHTKREKNSL